MRKIDLALIEHKFKEFEKKIETLKRLENELNSLDSEGVESEVDALRSKLRSLDKIPELERRIAELKRKLDEKSVEAASKAVRGVTSAPRNAYGVVIGIGKYSDLGIRPLKYAKEDAQAIYDILTNPTYGNFPKENVKLLLDEKATLAEIKSAMGTYLARNAGEDDMVCIYFAGHGSPEIDPTGKSDDKLEKFIVPYDAKKDDLFSYGLPMDDIEVIFHRITSKRVVFFLDCCYSGEAGGRTFSRPDVRNITISEKFLEQLSGEGRIIITASKPDELSREIDELKHGIFTYYLVEGLKGKADLNGDGFVTVDELYDYVNEQVEEKARQLGGKQHTVWKGEKVGEIPLTRCETKTMRRIKELNATAAEQFEKGEYREAIKNWEEVLKIDGKNAEALDEIKDAKKCILIDLHEKGMPSKLFNEAMTILKKDPSTYTPIEEKLSKYVVELLKGNLSFENYVDIRNTLMKAKT